MSECTISECSELVKIISKQAGVDDLLLVEKTYYECKSDITKTILTLLNKEIPKLRHEKDEHLKTVLDDVREILDEKEAIFYDRFKST